MASMKKTTTKPTLLLLDAMVIIDAHHWGVWDKLVKRVQLVLPATIAGEAQFYKDKDGIRREIKLKKLIDNGVIDVKTISAAAVNKTTSKFDTVFAEGIHAGEKEALALIDHDITGECLFCSTDFAALKALAMLGYSDRGISLEKALDQLGLRQNLPERGREEFFRAAITEGATIFIQKMS